MKLLAVATAMASSLRLGAGAAALERGPLYYYHGLLVAHFDDHFNLHRLAARQ